MKEGNRSTTYKEGGRVVKRVCVQEEWRRGERVC